MKILDVIDLGLVEYEEAHILQKGILAEKKRSGGNDCILLTEHPNVFTIGRSGSRENIFAEETERPGERVRVVEADRGGDVTFHGPGQLVAYPLFDLNAHTKDVRRFIKNLERVLELSALEYGLTADRHKQYTGLWVDGKKIGFIGIGVSGWVTYHGLSINANVDLKYFSMIRACGIDGLKVGSIKSMLKRSVEISPLKETLLKSCREVFGFDYLRRREKKTLRDAVMA